MPFFCLLLVESMQKILRVRENSMVRLAGFEPAVSGFGGQRFIQLNYRRIYKDDLQALLTIELNQVELNSTWLSLILCTGDTEKSSARNDSHPLFLYLV